MHKNIVKIKKEVNEYLVFTSEGMLISLNDKEFKIFSEFGSKKKINKEHADFLGKLASYGVLEFDDFNPEEMKREYDLSLKNHNSSRPLYPAPVLAHLSITNKCNMACKYCSVRKLHKTCEKELSTKQWKDIISKLAEWGVFQIGFTGGEPTLRKDLPELVEHVHKKGCVFNLTTNGWFLDEDLVYKLVCSGMKQCQVSLDSHIPKTHDKLRGNNSHNRALKSIKILQNYGVAVGIDCVVSRNNIKDIMKFVEWIETQKIPYLTLIKLKKGDLSDKQYSSLAPNYSEYSEIIRLVCSRKENKNPNITLDCGSVSNLQQVASKDKFSEIPVAGCPIGHHLICISPNGEIYACAALLDKKFCLGNILKDNIEEIWKNNSLLKNFRLIKKKVNGNCKNCERLDLCRGGCRGIAYSASKELFVSDPTCKFNDLNYNLGGVK